MSTSKKQILVTSELPHVSGMPHLGNITNSILSADVYARYLRSNLYSEQKTNVIFIGGVDEYGVDIEINAKELGISCKQFCDECYGIHKNIYEWFKIDFDCYGRTSEPDGNPRVSDSDWPQARISKEIYQALCKNNQIIEKDEYIMYCPRIDTCVTNNYVMGMCKYCRSEISDIYPCNTCGKTLMLCDIMDPRYKRNPMYGLELKITRNLYLDVGKIWQNSGMIRWMNSVSQNWSNMAKSITSDYLKQELQPQSITEDHIWGTIVPYTTTFGDVYKHKSFNKLFEILMGYMNIIEECMSIEESEFWWKDQMTHIVQFVSKDNVLLHSVMFPAILRGSKYSAIQNIDIIATDSMMYEGRPFSKQLFCDDVIKISEEYNLLPDHWRAYLIYIHSENPNFILNEFVNFINNTLVGNLSNMLYRAISIAYHIKSKYNVGTIDKKNITIELDVPIKCMVSVYKKFMNTYKLSDAFKMLFRISSRLNTYIDQIESHILNAITIDPSSCQYISDIYTYVINLSYMIDPFMPTIGQRIRNEFNATIFQEQHKIHLPAEKTAIFNRIPAIDYIGKN